MILLQWQYVPMYKWYDTCADMLSGDILPSHKLDAFAGSVVSSIFVSGRLGVVVDQLPVRVGLVEAVGVRSVMVMMVMVVAAAASASVMLHNGTLNKQAKSFMDGLAEVVPGSMESEIWAEDD